MGKGKGKKQALEVEDHGNGFMVVGTNKIPTAREELRDYVDDVAPYVYAAVTHYDGRSAVWLATGPAEHWDGALDHCGNPLPRP